MTKTASEVSSARFARPFFRVIFSQPCFFSVLELLWGSVMPEICKVSSRTLESPSLPIFEGSTCTQGPEKMCLSLEHQNPSKTFEKMGYFDGVTVSLHIL